MITNSSKYMVRANFYHFKLGALDHPYHKVTLTIAGCITYYSCETSRAN